jgi:hypothetical protein
MSVLVLGACGEIGRAICQDHEMLMAVPACSLPDLVEGLKATHEQGIRYPIPTYLRYTPEVAFSVPLADIFRAGEIERVRKR